MSIRQTQKMLLVIVTALNACQAIASSEYTPTDSETAGGLFYRLAVLVDGFSVTFFDFVVVVALACIIGGLCLWVSANKNNLPKRMGLIMVSVGFCLAGFKGCMSMNAQTFLNESEVQAVTNVESLNASGFLDTNTD
ncbi:hypothetical protein [Vibrio agarivorans]|uniref:hypothetical protein n=1 Tax=Vibrio agarivorans TaxID=153622 RepID=UPI0025B5F456|nr:hypothetical protein [Vibrio agarivorans]MDN3661070.1 hypothetical protein [Vibrio agarivorans]